MTKKERNKEFAKMLKEYPKYFGRLSFRDRLLVRVAFDYVLDNDFAQTQTKLLGERCNQLLKDKGDLTDRLDNQMVAYETLKLHDQEEIGMLNSKVTELENKIADIKANCDLAVEGRDVKIKGLKEQNSYMFDTITLQEQQIEKMKRHCNCKHRDGEGYCEVKRTSLMDLSYDGCDKWELED